jgi:hypothetical protein
MKKVLLVAVAMTLALLGGRAVSAKDRKAERKAEIAPRTVEVERSLFSGSESRIYELGALRPDCTSPIADIRIVKPAMHGEVRFEEVQTVIVGGKHLLQKFCRGKTVDAVRTFYKANENFAGKDQFVIDIDSKVGAVWRYTFTMNVR